MDEFADLERELSNHTIMKGHHDLERLVIDIEEGDSKSNTIFWREEIDLNPKDKRNRLIFGVLFTPLMGLGLLLIWSVIRLGSIDEQTSIIRGRAFHKKQHSFVNYEIQNGRVHSVKLAEIGSNAYIKKSKNYYGSSGDWRWDFEIINGRWKNTINLLSIDHKDDDSRDHIVPEFAERIHLDIRESYPYSLANQLKNLFAFMIAIVSIFIFAFIWVAFS